MNKIKADRPFSHIRIYANPYWGHDIILRVRGGLLKHATHETIGQALGAAYALEGRNPCDPIFVYDRPLADELADRVLEKLALNPPLHPVTNIGE